MNDEHLDELLLHAARDYNAPAAVPREEIWSRIEAARSARRQPRSAGRLWIWPSLGVAAAVLLAVGVVLGRRFERSTINPSASVAATKTAPRPDAPATPEVAIASTPVDSTAEIIGKLREETKATDRRVRELAANERAPLIGPADGSSSEASAALSYKLVVLKHLAGSEAMITAFRSAARRGEIDAQIADWTKELLSTTRMLEASAVTQDPMMRRLLEDLDLVLAQIRQYVTRGTTSPDDLDLIEQSIIKRGVMTKLRSTLPVRNVPAGT